MKIVEFLQSRRKATIITWSLALVAAILVVDYITPVTVSFFMFYAVPVFIVAWSCGTRVGLGFSVAVSLLSWVANLPGGMEMSIYVWRGINRMVAFFIVATCGIVMRREREILQARIQAMERSRHLEREIVRVSENEQIRIGQDLHDGLCQTLVAIDFAAASIRSDMEQRQLPEAEEVRALQKLLQGAVVEARSLARGIFPVQMDSTGLATALEELIGTMNRLRSASISLEVEGDIRIKNPQVAMHLYRIAQEAMSNALRHGRAHRVTVRMVQDDEAFMMTIVDDGCGFDSGVRYTQGMGLRTIRYRAGEIGAHLQVDAKPREGTIVSCRLPMSANRGTVAIQAA